LAYSLSDFARYGQSMELDNGKPALLEPHGRAFFTDVFAGIPECWWVVPEGNAKTTKLGLFVDYHLDRIPEANVAVAAAGKRQAMTLYRQAKGFLYRAGLLSTQGGTFDCLDGYRVIRNNANESRAEIFAQDADAGDGIIPTLCVCEEPHRWPNLDLYRTWAGKLGKRKAQILVASTAGEPGSDFDETLKNIRSLAPEQKLEGAYLRAAGRRIVLHEWAVRDENDIEDMRKVKAANPHSEITVKTLAEKRSSPTMNESHWRRFTCNLPTRTTTPAVTEKEWREALYADPLPEGVPVVAGLDVGWRYDSTALVPLWTDGAQRVLGEARILVPPVDGQLELAAVERAIVELHERNPISLLVMDISDARDVHDFAVDQLGLDVEVRSVGTKAQVTDYALFMEALRAGELKHTGDPGLTRHVLNATVRLMPLGDAVFARPGLSRNTNAGLRDRRQIDALVAAAYANTAVAANPASVYDERGLIAV
jgi:phage terminase large subunit-like protein